MKQFILVLFVMISGSFVHAQEPAYNPLEAVPYIEVTGEGEMEVVPDEIYLRFTLKERYDGKNKTDLGQIESQLTQLLKKNNFNLENLSLADAGSDYISIKKKKKDVLQSKDFVLKISTTTELTGLWEILDEVEAQNAYVSRVDHSQLENLKKEVKIQAVKNAQEKAGYLLEAAGEAVGKVLFMQERESYIPALMTRQQSTVTYKAAADEAAGTEPEPEISFQKIKLTYKVFVRYAIKGRNFL